MDKSQLTKDYNTLLNDVKSILQRGLTKAYKAVDNNKGTDLLASRRKNTPGGNQPRKS